MTYTYDDRGQVTDADYDYQTNEDYTYDENGNRTTGIDSSLHTNATFTTGDLNRLSGDGTYTYEYDDEGNRTKRIETVGGETTVYEWDHRNRLTKVETFDKDPALEAGETLEKEVGFTYDVFNRWIGREVDPDGETGSADIEQTKFVYDGGQIALQFDKTGTGDLADSDLSHRYLWGPAVDQILADEAVADLSTAGDVLWPLADNLGTVRDLVEYTGGLTLNRNHIKYDAFGNVTAESDSAVDHLFGYTGRAFDEETGLQNNLNRWYDATIGQWISEDPIGISAGDPNFYRYVGNFVTGAIDPSGLEPPGSDSSGVSGKQTREMTKEYKEYLDSLPKANSPDEILGSTWGQLKSAFNPFELYYELNGYKLRNLEGCWYWVPSGGKSPIQKWKEDADKIPFNPAPTDTIEAAASGDLPRAAKLLARDIAVGQAFKYGGKIFKKMSDGTLGLAAEGAEELGENLARKLSSRIGQTPALVRHAQSAGKSCQKGLDALRDQLKKGNMTPGIGTKHLFGGVFEARARDGARLYFRNGAEGTIEILGKSNKSSQTAVINILKDLYGS